MRVCIIGFLREESCKDKLGLGYLKEGDKMKILFKFYLFWGNGRDLKMKNKRYLFRYIG